MDLVTTSLGALLIPGGLLLVFLAGVLLRVSVHAVGAGPLTLVRALVGAAAILAGQAAGVALLLAVSPPVAVGLGVPVVLAIAILVIRGITGAGWGRALLAALLQGVWLVAAATVAAAAVGAIWAAVVRI